MTRFRLAPIVVGILACGFSGAVAAQGAGRGEGSFQTELSGYDEVITNPLQGVFNVGAVNSAGAGSFRAHVRDENRLEFELNYTFPANTVVQQAHIHFGLPSTTGGIMAFLCTNLGNAPASPPAREVPACPTPSTSAGPVTGTITAADIIGPTGQGLPAGDFAAFLAALRNDAAYVNVHTNAFPTGEIRGQIR